MKKIKRLIFALVVGGATLGVINFAGQLGFERSKEVLQQTIGVTEFRGAKHLPARPSMVLQNESS